MATYSPTTTQTIFTGTTSTGSLFTLFTANASSKVVTRLTGAFSMAATTSSTGTAALLITPTAGSSSANGATEYLLNVTNTTNTSTVEVSANGQAVTLTITSTVLGLNIANGVIANMTSGGSGNMLFADILVPPGYVVQVSGSTYVMHYGFTQEELS